ncbi:MAG: hypothetical protein JWL73_1129 [Actinomycetia bacterium]|nr:hypothetical protein [Actinomycetes bacterium]
MTADPRLDGIESRIDELFEELGAQSEAARSAAEELLALAVQLHRPALVGLLDALHDGGGDQAVRRVAADEIVGGVLTLHDLHPLDLEARIRSALTELGRGGAVTATYLGVDGSGVAHVRVDESGSGCGSGCGSGGSSGSVEVEAAVIAAAPELVGVRVEAPAATPSTASTSVTLPMPTVRIGGRATAAPAAPTMSPGTTTPADARSSAPRHDGCELCGEGLDEEHRHGVDTEQRRLVCLCRPCSIVLGADGAGQGRFRALPERVLADPDFAVDDVEWEALGIPVSTAFFFHDSAAGGMVAFYPSPAGATESLLGEGVWELLAAESDVAGNLRDDVEAMLVRRTRAVRESYLVPIDVCYSLVGLLRTHWKGFDGGQEAHEAIDGFFADVRARSRSRTAALEETARG